MRLPLRQRSLTGAAAANTARLRTACYAVFSYIAHKPLARHTNGHHRRRGEDLVLFVTFLAQGSRPHRPTPAICWPPSARKQSLTNGRAAYAPATLAAANTALRSYAGWCYLTGHWPDETGITDDDLVLYIAFLARTLSISLHHRELCSLGVARFHKQYNLPWRPLHQRFGAQATLRGIQRTKGSTAHLNRKLPVTPEMLAGLRRAHNLASASAGTRTIHSHSGDVLRLPAQSNVLITTAHQADGSYTVHLRTTKTQQTTADRPLDEPLLPATIAPTTTRAAAWIGCPSPAPTRTSSPHTTKAARPHQGRVPTRPLRRAQPTPGRRHIRLLPRRPRPHHHACSSATGSPPSASGATTHAEVQQAMRRKAAATALATGNASLFSSE